jgi:SAM-dependent methyltransferase
MDTPSLINHVQGSLSAEGCNLLYRFASELPDEAVIVDLNCGHGRSTIALCYGLTENGKSASVIACDPHAPKMDTTVDSDKDGSLMAFIRNLKVFQAHPYVTPMVQGISEVPRFIQKQLAHLVVAHIPTQRVPFHDSMDAVVEVSQHLVRKNGHIILICSNSTDRAVFAEMSSILFPETSFKLVEDIGSIRVYRASKGTETVEKTGSFQRASGKKPKTSGKKKK